MLLGQGLLAGFWPSFRSAGLRVVSSLRRNCIVSDVAVFALPSTGNNFLHAVL